MHIEYSKQSKKYLDKIDLNTYIKLKKALDGLQDLKGDIIKLRGNNQYRLKIYHYRIIFTKDTVNGIINVEEINTRGNVY